MALRPPTVRRRINDWKLRKELAFKHPSKQSQYREPLNDALMHSRIPQADDLSDSTFL